MLLDVLRLGSCTGGNAQAFARVRTAFEVLSCRDKRKVYDEWANVLEFRHVHGVAARAPGGEDALFAELSRRGVHCDPKTQLVITCEVCRRPATTECWVCHMQICEFCTLKRHWKGAFALHWPIINSKHMRVTLAKRELEAKRLEDAKIADLADVNYRSQAQLKTIREFKLAAYKQAERPDATTHYEHDLGRFYLWSQSETHVLIVCHVPTGFQDKDVNIECQEQTLKVQPEMSPAVINRRLAGSLSTEEQITAFKTQDNNFHVLILPKSSIGVQWKQAFDGDSDGVRSLQPLYQMYELDDEVVLELKLPFWIDAEDIRVKFSELGLTIWVRNNFNITRHFWNTASGEDRKLPQAVQPDLCSWSLDLDQDELGEKVKTLTITLARPEVTESEIQWKKGVRQDNRVKEQRDGSGKKGVRFFLEDEDEFGMEDVAQAVSLKHWGWAYVPIKPWALDQGGHFVTRASDLSSAAQKTLKGLE